MKLLKVILPVCGAFTLGLLSLQLGCSGGSSDSSQETEFASGAESLTFKPKMVIPRAFPAIKKIDVLPADKASTLLGDRELVLGVSIGEQSRAYPITMLCGPTREIINDELGGTKIAATW